MPKAPKSTTPEGSDSPSEGLEGTTGAPNTPDAPEGQGTPTEPAGDTTEQTAPAPTATKNPRRRPSPAIDDLFGPLEEVREYLRVLSWGREGSGKTTAALQMSNHGRVLVINAEGGLKKKALASQGVDVSRVSVYPAQGQAITHAGLDQVFHRIKADLTRDPNSWAGVIMDSVSDVVQGFVDQVSDDRVTKARKRGAEIDEFDAFFTDRSDYGTMSKMVRDILRKLRGLDCHLVITALERADVDQETGKTMYGPDVSPSLQKDLLGYVDVVMYHREPDEDHDYYRAATSKSGKFRSKDRYNALPRVLVEPSFTRLLGYIEGNLDAATDPLQTKAAEPAPKASKARTGKKAQGSKTPDAD